MRQLKLAQGGPGSHMHKHEGWSTFYSSWRKGVHGPPCADFKVEGLHLLNATEPLGRFINTTSWNLDFRGYGQNRPGTKPGHVKRSYHGRPDDY